MRLIIAGLDRDAIARGHRRTQALEALEFERERERALRAQIEQLVLETEGPRIDAEAFSRLDPADVDLVRSVLDDPFGPTDDDDALADDGGYVDLEAPEEDAGDADELEIARLGEEIDASRALQAALERYVAALDAGPG